MKANILDAVDLGYQAWKAITQETIVNCFLASDSMPPTVRDVLHSIHRIGTVGCATSSANKDLLESYKTLIQTGKTEHAGH
jgi:hypothetical protein